MPHFRFGPEKDHDIVIDVRLGECLIGVGQMRNVPRFDRWGLMANTRGDD